jgi:gliding motility-associated-like protein
MQIIVDDIPNLRPIINAPNDTCVIAGSALRIRATAFDQDDPPDFLYLSAFGEPFEVSISPASFTPNTNDSLASPAAINFQWNTQCVHVRKKPYRVVFKVFDARPLNIQLTDFGETNITVIGPGPILDTALIENNAIRLQWQPYTCTNARNMKIFRRKGDFPFSIDSCLTGGPPGFDFIGQVDINTTTFLDDNNGEGLDKGPKYCYVLVAEFPDFAESRPSNEKCNELPLNIPLITNVDVDITNANGRINVNWTRPLDLDSVIYPPMYRYDLYNQQAQILFTTNELSDTSFVWNGPNTIDTLNTVNLEFFTAGGIEQSSAEASSVFLETNPGGQRVQLDWSANVPWTNNGFYHLIYRESNNSGFFELLDSTFAEGESYSYLDQGQGNGIPLIDGDEYCYYIETRGSYFNSSFSDTLINRSQIACEIPRDSTAPCPPNLSLDIPDCDSIYANKDCGSIVADLPNSNKLIWNPDFRNNCDTSIKEYRIYFRRNLDLPFTFLDKVNFDTSTYTHDINTNLSGCYVVTAVDSFGNESEFSNEVCRDNCTYFSLPNTFSPNKDSYNNTFIPCPEPRFVKEIRFKVYNRWGLLVNEINDDPQINWDGLDLDGNELPSGYYFYEADVEFFRLNPEEAGQTFKGWIWLVR